MSIQSLRDCARGLSVGSLLIGLISTAWGLLAGSQACLLSGCLLLVGSIYAYIYSQVGSF